MTTNENQSLLTTTATKNNFGTTEEEAIASAPINDDSKIEVVYGGQQSSDNQENRNPTSAPSIVILGHESVEFYCVYCKTVKEYIDILCHMLFIAFYSFLQTRKTKVELVNGWCVWIAALFCIVFGCVFGCCLFPFCVDSFKDKKHECSVCGCLIGTTAATIKQYSSSNRHGRPIQSL